MIPRCFSGNQRTASREVLVSPNQPQFAESAEPSLVVDKTTNKPKQPHRILRKAHIQPSVSSQLQSDFCDSLVSLSDLNPKQKPISTTKKIIKTDYKNNNGRHEEANQSRKQAFINSEGKPKTRQQMPATSLGIRHVANTIYVSPLLIAHQKVNLAQAEQHPKHHHLSTQAFIKTKIDNF